MTKRSKTPGDEMAMQGQQLSMYAAKSGKYATHSPDERPGGHSDSSEIIKDILFHFPVRSGFIFFKREMESLKEMLL